MRDRSLDEFLSGGADGDTEGGRDDGGDGSDPERDAGGDRDADPDPDAPPDPDPDAPPDPDPDAPRPEVTMRRDVDATCPACGASAPRRWREGDRFVCADCKEW